MTQIPDPMANGLMDALSGLLTASKAPDRVGYAERLLVRLWKLLPPERRRRFLGQADADSPSGFLEWRRRWPDLNDPTLESAARCWGVIAAEVRENGTDFERGFVNNVEKCLGRRGKPTDKQIPIMKRMYVDWRQARDTESRVIE